MNMRNYKATFESVCLSVIATFAMVFFMMAMMIAFA